MCDIAFSQLIALRREEDRQIGLVMREKLRPRRPSSPARDLSRPVSVSGIAGMRNTSYVEKKHRPPPLLSSSPQGMSPTSAGASTPGSQSPAEQIGERPPELITYPRWQKNTNIIEFAIPTYDATQDAYCQRFFASSIPPSPPTYRAPPSHIASSPYSDARGRPPSALSSPSSRASLLRSASSPGLVIRPVPRRPGSASQMPRPGSAAARREAAVQNLANRTLYFDGPGSGDDASVAYLAPARSPSMPRSPPPRSPPPRSPPPRAPQSRSPAPFKGTLEPRSRTPKSPNPRVSRLDEIDRAWDQLYPPELGYN